MQRWVDGFASARPERPARVTLRSQYPGALVDALAQGRVEVASFAREMFMAEQSRFAALSGAEPVLVPVAMGSRATKSGTHAIVFFVHASNPLGRISVQQLCEVLASDGRIRTWGDLGVTGEWAGRRISVHGMRVRRETGNPPGIVNFLEQRVLRGRSWRADVSQYDDVPGGPQALELIVRAVGSDEGGLGYSGFAYAQAGVKPLALAETPAGPFLTGTAAEIAGGSYPLGRTLYLAMSSRSSPAAREFLAFVLGPVGQQAIIADPHGFCPLAGPALAEARRQLAALRNTPRDDASAAARAEGAPFLKRN